MSNYDSDSYSDNDWEDRGELAWNEFDWENYLRNQDEVIARYVKTYENLPANAERLDEVARQMGWDREDWRTEIIDSSTGDDEFNLASAPEIGDLESAEPYTLHRNPIFVATRGIYSTLKKSWQDIAGDATLAPQRLALVFQTSLFRAEEQAVLGIQALDFGDYAMAISLFKRALRELNVSFALAGDRQAQRFPAVATYSEMAMPRLFDLREIWLRVMSECREELERPSDTEDES